MGIVDAIFAGGSEAAVNQPGLAAFDKIFALSNRNDLGIHTQYLTPEIMHLVAHKGKLYAANGYWADARWLIPPDAERQS